MSAEVLGALIGIGATVGGALITYLIKSLVRQVRLETRMDNYERHLRNLGELYRKQNTDRRAS